MQGTEARTPPANQGRPRASRQRRATSDEGVAVERIEEQPLRAELFSVSQLERYAKKMAGWHEVATAPGRGSDRLLARLAENETVLGEAYALVTGAVVRGRQITPAAEWFIDNYPLVQEQIRTARKHLPRSYNRELPRLTNGGVLGTPRVYDIALELISHAHGRVDAEGLRAFVAAYQTEQPLRVGELWAIPIMLRLALLENLRRVAAAIMAGRRDRERAACWVDKMIDVAAKEPTRVVLVLADMVEEDPPLTDAFAAEFASRLQGQASALTFAESWLDQRLAEKGQTVDHIFQLASQSQAADQVSIGNSIGSLRFLAATDWRDFVESMSVLDRTLREDPSGDYPTMEFATRDRYRHVVEALARRSSLSEDAVARAAIELTRDARADGSAGRRGHVGYVLVDRGLASLERRVGARRTPLQWLRGAAHRARLLLFAGTIVALSGIIAWLLTPTLSLDATGVVLVAWWALVALAASPLAVALVNWAATLLVSPKTLPRLDFAPGIPPSARSLVAVPTMLTDAHEIDELVEALEVRFLANRDPNLAFALVTDLRDAATESTEGDAALIERARRGIERLAAKYSDPMATGGFYLFHRARRWNPREGVWMGWERKRGKLEQLNAALRGDASGFALVVGPLERLQSARYVISLDSDTALPRDSARLLAATMAHPLNQPVYDAAVRRVVSGYGILQPRVASSMESMARSRFARLFGGDPGIDPYTRAVSDVYQDVFGEGSYVGKGIYDIDAVRKAIEGRFPDDRVLSHDLLEGAYARAGLVSDVLLVEDFPSSVAVDATRRFRWIRGDWQIASWLGSRVPGAAGREANSISALSRWKILDNLRRSVAPAALLALLVAGWFAGAAPQTTAALVAMMVLPSALASLTALARRPEEARVSRHLRETAASFGRQVGREFFALACLPYDALLSLAALARASVRVLFTHKKLLEWRTASDAARAAQRDLTGTYSSMWLAPTVALGVAAALAARSGVALAAASPVLALWVAGPALAWWSSTPSPPKERPLSARDTAFLRRISRRTWRFFEAFVGVEDHHLPPDNFQEEPPVGLAHRTSPTNIGMSMIANLAALDFGYLSAARVVERTSRTLDSLDRLQRYRGHLYNWYETTTLEPLRPIYISTVDSGNLAGHLLTLAVGLEQMEARPILGARVFAGLADTLTCLADEVTTSPDVVREIERMRKSLATAPPSLRRAHTLLERLETDAAELSLTAADHGEEAVWWLEAFAAQVRDAALELTSFAPWLALPAAGEPAHPFFARVPTLADVAEDPPLGAVQDEPYRAAIALGAERACRRIAEASALAARCRAYADLDYEFLYDRGRKLLAIGYNVGDRRLDASFYDLLASEARLTSFVAIAQGKLPQEHWFSLGRSLTSHGGRPALLSWSGSMFEYLMPLLVMPSYERTLLDETHRAIVERQIEYGRERSVAWGVSESGYAKTDVHLNYQYRAFGVPGLGFKRGLADDVVIAPYASALALLVAPKAACANLRRLEEEGQLGRYGFFEAIDYTPSRLPRGKDRETVRSYMAHHQGMSFLSLAFVLLDRPMQRRFGSDPAFRATDLLLQERVPPAMAIYPHPAEVSSTGASSTDAAHEPRVFTTANTPIPEVHLLSNGQYHVAITNAGGGYSRWRDLAITRWHEDLTRDCWGTFGYLRDVDSGRFWSVAHQPTLQRPTSYEAIYSQGRAEFRRVDGDIDTHVEISVSPEDDVELRRVCLTNRGRTPRTIELTSFAEVVLTQPAADAAHPAFSNLFVQTEILRAEDAILCTRRPRSGGERPPWMLHQMMVNGEPASETSFETSRAAFIGRGRTPCDPVAMYQAKLGDSEGSVLDPIVAIRSSVTIAPNDTARIHVVTGVAETRDGALSLADKYRDRHVADRVFELSWTHSQVLQRRLDAGPVETQLYERLASHVLYANVSLRAPKNLLARNRGVQSGLWAYGISGDLPIVLVRIADGAHIEIVRQLVKAHAYWRLKGLTADLVIWNEDPSGYRQVLQDEIMGVIASLNDAALLDKPGGIFVRRSEQISEDDRILMQTVARVILGGGAGTLAEQIERHPRIEPLPPALPQSDPAAGPPLHAAPAPSPVVERSDLAGFNGFGGFTPDGREYVIVTGRDRRTPAPWVNVLANPWFGSVVSESGGAYTWCENAHSYRLTPWRNDAVCDTSGEAFYLRDEEDGSFWSPTPLPASAAAPYTTRHGFGYTIFEVTEGGITSELKTYVATDAPVKFVALTLRNDSGRTRRLSVSAMFEMVLGAQRSANLTHVVTELDVKSGALFARNAYGSEFAGRVAFLDCSGDQRNVTGDRTEFIGRNGSLARPESMARTRLSGRVGAGLDPCLAMQTTFDVADGHEREIVFVFGSGLSMEDARHLVHRFRGCEPARVALEGVWAFWNRTLGAVNVQTPDPALNFLANGWLVYQVLACRMWGRSGFYQSGGAYGFRDQLQDSMALIHAQPALLREQILRSAARQFREGDVQHWWHPPLGRGVRTRISDDYLFLPYAVCRYVAALGDTGVLDEVVPFIEGRPVKLDEDSYYDLPARAEESATVYEHCIRAIRSGLRFGAHGLPLMGSGDWNDGMNLVGEGGKGESVWLAFFLYDVLMRFAALARRRDDGAFADTCVAEAALLRKNIEAQAWDGSWYRRAYFDDGSPLGSSSSLECQIDSLPQSWAVLSKAGDPERARSGLAAVDARLVRRDLGLIQLFDPPFDASALEPGYIKGYVPGVRENGGQYTHAAVWAVMAFVAAGDVERAWELFRLINPVHHGDSPEKIAVYRVEPYVAAADVYTNPQHAGRGGWTWYTGSAGWMYQLIVESLLGLRLDVDRLFVEPKVPAGWQSFDVHYRYRETVYHVHVRVLGGAPGVRRVLCDQIEQPSRAIPLRDDRREHHALVEVGAGGA